MTIGGALVMLVMVVMGRKIYRIGPNYYCKIGHGWGGVEMGAFFLISEDAGDHTIYHEAGHGIQNIILGPLMPTLVSIPSALRYWFRRYLIETGLKNYNELSNYDSVWFEHWATTWGYKYYSEREETNE